MNNLLSSADCNTTLLLSTLFANCQVLEQYISISKESLVDVEYRCFLLPDDVVFEGLEGVRQLLLRVLVDDEVVPCSFQDAVDAGSCVPKILLLVLLQLVVGVAGVVEVVE